MKSFILCVLMLVAVSAVLGEIPSDWPKCKNGDEECLIKAYQYVVQKYHAGVPALGLPAFDPMHINTVILQKDAKSSVNIDVKLSDMDALGMKHMKINKISGFKADLSGRSTFEAVIPDLFLKGHYAMDGHVLVLPIVGDGPFEIHMKNAHIKYSFDLKPIEKDGHIYAALHHVKLDMVPDDFHIKLDNLFNGNTELSDNANDFFNKNWQIIFNEMKGNILKPLSLILKSGFNAYLQVHPYAEYFL